MRWLVPLLLLLPSLAEAQAKAGWGNVGKQEDKGFSWTDPLWPDFWMAWTPATLAVFIGIFGAIAVIGLLEGFKYRDGIERKGVLGLTTTLGDRLFITLLGSAFINLAWLGVVSLPQWGALIVCLFYAAAVFRWV